MKLLRENEDQYMKIPVTVIISTKNEEANINKCVSSCVEYDEVIVVDSNSKDSTVEIARSLGVQIVNFTWNGLYPKKRQWIIDNVQVKNNWILFLDADEEVSSPFNADVIEFLRMGKGKYVASRVQIQYFFMHRELKHGQRVKKIVLMKKGYCSYPPLNDLASAGMGEIEGHYQPLIDGKVFDLASPIIHSDTESIDSWMRRHIKYAEWESLVKGDKNLRREVGLLKDLFPRIFLKLPFRSFFIFIYSYLFKFGFLDGRNGFDYAFSKAWYYWLASAIIREKKYSQVLKKTGDPR